MSGLDDVMSKNMEEPWMDQVDDLQITNRIQEAVRYNWGVNSKKQQHNEAQKSRVIENECFAISSQVSKQLTAGQWAANKRRQSRQIQACTLLQIRGVEWRNLSLETGDVVQRSRSRQFLASSRAVAVIVAGWQLVSWLYKVKQVMNQIRSNQIKVSVITSFKLSYVWNTRFTNQYTTTITTHLQNLWLNLSKQLISS